MDAVSEARGRRWADIAAILASVTLFGFSIWGGVLAGDSDSLSEVRNIGLARGSNILGGLLGVLGIFAAQKSRAAGRALVIAAGLVALAGMFAFRVLDGTSVIASGAPGLVLLIAGFFVGPMPTERERLR
jgi:hypothetical protein